MKNLSLVSVLPWNLMFFIVTVSTLNPMAKTRQELKQDIWLQLKFTWNSCSTITSLKIYKCASTHILNINKYMKAHKVAHPILTCNLYKIVVLPAPSKPTIKIRYSRRPQTIPNNLENVPPF